jgi:RNA polymerase sigma-70 factor (ECF subfamily)
VHVEGALKEARAGEVRAERTAPLVAARQDERDALYLGFVQTYYQPIVRYVYSMVSNQDLAEDLTQDTFLKAYLALPAVGPPENPRAWLYRIATNTCLDHLRKQKRVEVVAWHRLAHVLRGANRFRSVDEADPLERAFDQLRADDRAILLLFAEGGLKAPEVAEALGITPAAARKRRQRAREAFTRAYQEATR